MTMAERQAVADAKRIDDAFFGMFQKLNAEHVAKTIAVLQPDTLDRRQEKLALIRELRDQTQSKSIYDRCVAIVGERVA